MLEMSAECDYTDARKKNKIYVIDRHGNMQCVKFDLITARNEELCSNPIYGQTITSIDCPKITADIVRRFKSGITTRELDAETADLCNQYSTHHTDYELLAARICINDLHKRTFKSLDDMIQQIIDYHSKAKQSDVKRFIRFSDEFIEIMKRSDARNRIDPYRDYKFRFFGYQTLMRSYLIHLYNEKTSSSLLSDDVYERPQDLYMRVALGIFACQPDGKGASASDEVFNKRLADAFKFYDMLSMHRVSNASPTLLNAGTNVRQMSSCFQLATGDDLNTLLDTVTHAGLISKWSGGISIWLHNIRADGAPIRSTGGVSTGIKNYIPVLNAVQEYVNQGGKRPGAFAMYLSVDHDDIFTFLQLINPKSVGELSAPKLKYALWVPDLFMEALIAQIENDDNVRRGGVNNPNAGDWYLFSPDVAPNLHLVYGDEYRKLVNKYISEGRYRRIVKAGEIVSEAFKSWAHSGIPYWLNKDNINKKSNMMNVAPISSSNLCVAGDTLILVKSGHKRIEELCGQQVDVWNGNEWSNVTVVKTNDAAELVRVTFDDGAYYIDCTPYHKFYVGNKEVRAAELKHGDLIYNEKRPIVGDLQMNRNKFNQLWTSIIVDGANYRIQSNNLDEARLMLQLMGCCPFVENGEIVMDAEEYKSVMNGTYAHKSSLPSYSHVHSVEPLEGLHKTYCFNEPLRHRGVFNGVLAGQCCEITIPSWSDFDVPEFIKFNPDNTSGESGVCNLASICLDSFVDDKTINYLELIDAARMETRVLNKIIDLNHYPTKECERSNRRHRPIGIGIMGLADVLARLELAYGSPEACAVARAIAASIYYGALIESIDLAKVDGPYESFNGSPFSKGEIQPDLWTKLGQLEEWEQEVAATTHNILTPELWAKLRVDIKGGIRNAYLTAYMPTATTSNIVNQNECFEPFTSNLYVRQTLAGEFTIVNRHLVNTLAKLNLWDEDMRTDLLSSGGSVKNIDRIPQDVKRRFLTAREIHPSHIIKMCKAMAPFIDQSMSMNLFLSEPMLPKITRFLVEGWRAGLKTGMYYCHTKPAAGAQKTAVSKKTQMEFTEQSQVCTFKKGCTTCSL